MSEIDEPPFESVPSTKPGPVAQADRVAQAVRLRVAGVTLDEIAKRLGWKSKQAVHAALQKFIGQARLEAALTKDELRHVETDRIDAIMRAHWAVATGMLDPVSRRRPRPAEQARAARIVLDCIDRRCKLLGLDAASMLNINHAGAVGVHDMTYDDAMAHIRKAVATYPNATRPLVVDGGDVDGAGMGEVDDGGEEGDREGSPE